MTQQGKAAPAQVQAPAPTEKPKKKWTDEQLTAIGMTDRTVLLSAAAGSGKTATLTERLIRRITDEKDPLDVGRMVVVTFTKKAAAELRERIAKALDGTLAKDPGNDRLAKQALLLPSASIRTIDSFCNDLLRTHAGEGGIPAGYRIASEAEVAIMQAQLMDALIDDAYTGAFPAGKDIPFLSECLLNVKQEEKLGDELISLYNALSNFTDPFAVIDRSRDALETAKTDLFATPWGDAIKAFAKDYLIDPANAAKEAFDALPEDVYPVFIENYEKTVNALADLADALFGCTDYEDFRKILTGFQDPGAGRGRQKKGEPVPPPDIPDAIKALRKEASDGRKALCGLLVWNGDDLVKAACAHIRALDVLEALLREFDARFREEKARHDLCDYADIERFALTLLCKDGKKTPLAEELTAAIDAVCIDEYQDVNDLQHRLFEAISTETDRFMVGDIKQSIYAFRGSDPSIFSRLRRSFFPPEAGKENTLLFLTRNFRSTPPVLEFCNAVFDKLFPILGGDIGYDPRHDALVPGKEFSANGPTPIPECTVYYAGVPVAEKSAATAAVAAAIAGQAGKTDEKERAEAVAGTAAQATAETAVETDGEEDGETDPDPDADEVLVHAVVKKIRELISSGETLNDGKPITYGDIAILTRKNKPAERYVSALRAAGIPVKYVDTSDFFLHEEILLLLSLCRVVNNPHRDIYLSAVLRSPLYHYSFSDLLRIRRFSEEGTLWDAYRAYSQAYPDDRSARFLTDLADFRAAAENMPTDRLIRFLCDRTGLFALTDADGKRRIYRFLAMARGYANIASGLYRFLDHVDGMLTQGKRETERNTTGDGDGVSVMSVHASKGLEFPVCILTESGTDGTADRSKLRRHRDLGVLTPACTSDGAVRLKTLFSELIANRAKMAAYEEETRILYVALTRAEERLYVFGKVSKNHIGTFPQYAALARRFPLPCLLAKTPSFLYWLCATLSPDDPRWLCTQKLYVAADPEPLPMKENGAAADTDGKTIASFINVFQTRFEKTYEHEAAVSLPGKLSVSKLYPDLLDEKDAASLPQPEEGSDGKEAPPTVPFFLSGIEPDAAAKAGTATHLFLQFCDFSALGSAEEVRKEWERLQTAGFLGAADAARVRLDEITAFGASDLCRRILDAKEIKREFRFHAWLPASSFSREHPEDFAGESLFVQGVIDLLLFDKNGDILLADYKTDRLPKEALRDPAAAREFLKARHEGQLGYYKDAVERIFGKPPVSVLLYSLHTGQAYEI